MKWRLGCVNAGFNDIDVTEDHNDDCNDCHETWNEDHSLGYDGGKFKFHLPTVNLHHDSWQVHLL